jgi:tRNA dimethylallyltransferase
MPRTGLVIAGLTGAGKSRVAMQVARQRAAEIINTDSVQLYRGMDVGSAKPTPADRAAVRHHLVDVADVAAPWTVVEVADAARDALLDVASRPDAGAPLLVGGAGYYLEALLHYAEAPRTPASTRGGRAVGPGGGLGGSARPGGWDAALSALAERDPEYARSLSRNDWQRLERAAEVLAAIAPGQTLRDCLPPKKARYYGPDATPLRLVPTFLTRSDADSSRRRNGRVRIGIRFRSVRP